MSRKNDKTKDIVKSYFLHKYNNSTCYVNEHDEESLKVLSKETSKYITKNNVKIPEARNGFLDSYLTEAVLLDIMKQLIFNRTSNPEDAKNYVMCANIAKLTEQLFGIKMDPYEIGLFTKRDVICECGAVADFVDSAVIYNGVSYGMIYLCPSCGARVGVHIGTNIPKGSLADKELQKYRKYAHYFFDRFWKEMGWPRYKAYTWIGEKMGIPEEEAHIGKFSIHQCKVLLAIISKEEKALLNE